MPANLLDQITQSAKMQELTLEQVIQAYKAGDPTGNQQAEIIPELASKKSYRFNLSTLATYIGGAIIFLGITFVVGVNWSSYSSVLQILLTLGLGLAFYLLACLINYRFPKYSFLANSTHLVGGLLIPIGVLVFLSLSKSSTLDANLILGLCFGALGIMYLLSDWVFKKGLPILIATSYFSISFWGFYSLIVSRFDASQLPFRITAIVGFFWGAIYLLLALSLWDKRRRWFSELCLVGGSYIVFISGFWLVESIRYGRITEIIYGIIFVPFFILASKIHSRWLLLLTTFGTLVWLIYLNSRYFLGRVNFGVGLIVSGLIIILGSLGAIELNKRLNKLK